MSYDITLSLQKKISMLHKNTLGNSERRFKDARNVRVPLLCSKKWQHSSFVAKINPHFFFAVAFNTTSTFFSSIVQRPCLKTWKERSCIVTTIHLSAVTQPGSTSHIIRLSYWTSPNHLAVAVTAVSQNKAKPFPLRNRTCIHFGVLHFPKTGLFHRFACPCLFYFAWLIFRCAVLFRVSVYSV